MVPPESSGESLSRKVARNTVFSALGYGVSILALFFLTPYIVRTLGLQLYGVWVLISVTAGYAGLTDLGLGVSLQKFVAEYRAKGDVDTINNIVRSGIAFYAMLGAVLLVVAWIVAHPILVLLEIPLPLMRDATFVFLVAVLNLALSNTLSVFASVLNGMQYIDIAKKIEMAVVVCRVLLYVGALVLGFGIVGLVLADTCLLILGAVINYASVRRVFPALRLMPWALHWAMFRKLFFYGGKLQVSRLSEMVNFQFDRIVVSKFVGLSFVAFADIGGRLLGRLRVLPMILLSSTLPAISHLQALQQEERIRLAFERSTKYLACSSVPLFIFVAAFAHPIINLWFDSSFSMAATTLQILALGYLVNVLTASATYVAQGIGDVTPQMWMGLIQAVANIVLSIALVFRMGYYGVMVGTSASLLIGGVYFLIAFQKMLPGSMHSALKAMRLPIVASLVSLVPALLLWFAFTGPDSRIGPQIGWFALSGIIYAAAYLVLLRVGSYFDDWDAQFIVRISPRLAALKYLIPVDRRA